jgi:hypothetical protein
MILLIIKILDAEIELIQSFMLIILIWINLIFLK